MKKLIFFIFVLAFVGCASLMMNIADRDETKSTILLASGDEVTILTPTIDEKLTKEVQGGGFTIENFSSMIQQKVIKELAVRGVKAKAGTDEEKSSIKINIDSYNRGIGFFRLFPIFGLGHTFLGGTIILKNSQGKRELEIKKVGQNVGFTQIGDQTKINVEYFAGALAAKISK